MNKAQNIDFEELDARVARIDSLRVNAYCGGELFFCNKNAQLDKAQRRLQEASTRLLFEVFKVNA